MVKARLAECHRAARHYAKGLCAVCYRARAYKARGPGYYAARRAANPERAKATYDRWYSANPGYHASWWAAHPAKHCALEQKRRARRQGSPGAGVSAEQFEALCEYFGRACAYCLRTGVKLTVDHVEPLVRGGAHDPVNVVPACHSCNASKGARTLLALLLRRGCALGSVMVESRG